eukprot:TRINITY_DN7780_c0_g1_i1.p1 TRINITY_DN7780_c0_g1~~TRINITY_DN7780_c0_g1_i1.p1  ORF type:complete len:513 (-),score=85.70 TRINITY_DN7780_c0_g1_i1:79-1584(-)
METRKRAYSERASIKGFLSNLAFESPTKPKVAKENDHNLRQAFCQQLSSEAPYKTARDITVHVVTFNVSESAPSLPEFRSLLLTKQGEVADLVGIALEEIDMSAQACMKETTEKGYVWSTELSRHLNSVGQYDLIFQEQMVGLMLLVFLARAHKPHLRHVRHCKIRFGAMGGRVGNKGAIAVRFSLYCRRWCLIAAHFAARKERWQQRNENYHQVCSDINFQHLPPEADDEVDFGLPPESKLSNLFRLPKHSYSHANVGLLTGLFDYVFCFGDLNYRIHGLENEEVKQRVLANDLQFLREHDQLLCSQRKREVFQDWNEGELTFPPSYKYCTGANATEYSDEKRQTPSWTDRILWFVFKKKTTRDIDTNQVELLSYHRVEYSISDHKPVVCDFKIRCASVDFEQFEQYVQSKLGVTGSTPLPADTEEEEEEEDVAAALEWERAQRLEREARIQRLARYLTGDVQILDDWRACYTLLDSTLSRALVIPSSDEEGDVVSDSDE